MSHPYTRVVFRVGDADARELEKGFGTFKARDLQNLEIGQGICRVERSDFDFNLSIPLSPEADETTVGLLREQVVRIKALAETNTTLSPLSPIKPR
jgi:hypothetical protein